MSRQEAAVKCSVCGKPNVTLYGYDKVCAECAYQLPQTPAKGAKGEP